MFFRLSHPFVVFLLIIALHVATFILKLVFFPRPPTTVRQARECLHSFTPVRESDDHFFRRMWPTVHQIVDKCSMKHFRHRLVKYGNGENSVIWLPWLVDVESHSCNMIFVNEGTDLTVEKTMKKTYQKCVVYSISPDHRESTLKQPNTSVVTVKQKMNAKSRPMTWGIEQNTRDSESMDLVYFIMVQAHRPRFDSINIFQGGADQIKLLFTKSPFDDANLSTCQFNVIYDRPRTRLQRREFKNTWRRLLYDRRYLIVSVRRFSNGNRLSFFIVNISEPYCWAKYVNSLPFIPKNI